MLPLKLYNTLARQKEIFHPLHDRNVGLYTCGPTVYNVAHIGNLRTYIFEDILRRTLEINGYRVKHVMNITDVGHLTSDADTGEDKMEKGSRREKKSVWDIADCYTKVFQDNLQNLNIKEPTIWCRATDHLDEQIALVKKLEKKGFTYRTSDGIYFDTSKFPSYGRLARLDIRGLKPGARVKIKKGKRHSTDFALWKFSPLGKKRQMEWNSPWGIGFPGWHLECSAMSTKYLGQPFDIHAGGIDHIPIHHTNEIAQSEAAEEKLLARFWLHGEFLTFPKGAKMAKSKENFLSLQTLKDKGYDPLAFRYLSLTVHYRSPLTFSWKTLDGIQETLNRLRSRLQNWGNPGIGCAEFESRFLEATNDDLNTPKALAILWELVKSHYPAATKKQSILKFDRILGLNLARAPKSQVSVPPDIRKLSREREVARRKKDFEKADTLRKKIERQGFEVQDTAEGPKITKNN